VKKLMSCLWILLFLAALHLPGEDLLLRKGRFYTFDRGILEGYDMLILNGKIRSIAKGIVNPGKVPERDLKGFSVVPGLIDSHNHIALAGEINEVSENITPEIDMAEQINPDDPNIYYCLTGGVTMVHLLHGSANPIGGRNVTVKLKWGESAEAMIERRALPTLKLALGENPKTATGGKSFPITRMGVAASIRTAFSQALEYRKGWEEWRREAKGRKKAPPSPKRDLRLEVLLEVLEGKRVVRCHTYRAEESLELMRIAKEYGFKIQGFEHFHQAYRIADELAKEKIGLSVFADSWNYKAEASEFTPYGFALLREKGVEISLNSDLSEAMRRLNIEAGKMVRYAGMERMEALKTITLNPARLLGTDEYVGSLVAGKDADLAVFDGDPLSPTSKCCLTIIEGKVYFDREEDLRSRSVKRVEEKEATR